MDTRTRRAGPSSWPATLLLSSALAAAAYAGRATAATGGAAAPPQDITRVESRLSQLEQRLFSIEASIRTLEQQSSLGSARATRPASDPEEALLRAEVGVLQRRLTEVECGLAKLDERTLTTAAREARHKSAVGAGDPCRLNADVPLRLSDRP